MKTNRTKNKNLFVKLCVFGFAAYVIVSLVTLQMEITAKRSQLVAVKQQIESQRIINKETERLLSLGDDKTYLARIARDKLDMGLSDERVFRDATGS
ncbi:septum formation initiator family protein [Oscillospiraceae bacterium PP1C4]